MMKLTCGVLCLLEDHENMTVSEATIAIISAIAYVYESYGVIYDDFHESIMSIIKRYEEGWPIG